MEHINKKTVVIHFIFQQKTKKTFSLIDKLFFLKNIINNGLSNPNINPIAKTIKTLLIRKEYKNSILYVKPITKDKTKEKIKNEQ